MLSIRMQRIGRKGHPTYRVVVQDSRWAPTSGRFVAQLGSYDPHTKTTTLIKEKAELYLQNGAQPSERVVLLFKNEGVKLPGWVKQPAHQKREIRNPEKLRRNRPAEEQSPEPAPSAEASEASTDTPAENTAEASTEPSIDNADSKPAADTVDTTEITSEQEKEPADSEPDSKPTGAENAEESKAAKEKA